MYGFARPYSNLIHAPLLFEMQYVIKENIMAINTQDRFDNSDINALLWAVLTLIVISTLGYAVYQTYYGEHSQITASDSTATTHMDRN